jgi:hypothetical protein
MLEFYKRNDHWLTAMDHNHIRITRIIALLLGPGSAQIFHNAIQTLVESSGRPVASQAMTYWSRAAYAQDPKEG